jgi:hypothetical protein
VVLPNAVPTPSPAPSWIGRWLAWADRPRARVGIVLLAVLLCAPCLNVGFAADDHMLRVRAGDDAGFEAFAATRWDLFMFMDGSVAQHDRLTETGTLAWWAAPDYRLGFMRPLSSITHALDFALWPELPMLMYAHSLLWLVILLTAADAVLRRFLPPSAAALALLLYAIDDARGPAVGFISNRNALLMATFGFVAMWAHDRARRDGWRAGTVIGPLAFAAGLLAGEGTIAALAYLFAHACVFDRAALRARVRALVPYALVLASWAILYKTLGYGTHGSGIYVDPGDRPLEFIAVAAVRIPVLLAGQWLGPWSDLWLGYPAALAPWVWGWCALVVVGFVVLVLARLGRDPLARMWLLASVLACVPIAGTFPADRLLGYVGLGSMGLVALLLVDREHARAGTAAPQRAWVRAAIAMLVGVHLVAAPLLLPIRARSMETVRRSLELFEQAVPRDPSIRARHVIVAFAPNDGMVSYLPVTRTAEHEPAPRSVRLLASSTGKLAFTRVDAHALVLDAERGLLSTVGERMVRAASVPFRIGERIELGHIDTVAVATIEAITTDGRPQRVRFDFARPLEDPSYLWLTWGTLGFVPWQPPAIGERVELPGFDVAAALAAALAGEH